MLQNYLNEWANARNNAVILEEQKDENGNLIYQRAEITFQGVKIEIRNKRIMIDNTPSPDDKFCAEFFVPSTLTYIDAFANSEYPHTEFVATMLEAIDPQAAPQMHDAISKRRNALDQFIAELKKDWTNIFEGSSYSQEDIDFLIDLAIGFTRRERVENITLFLETMVKHKEDVAEDVIVIYAADGKEITAKDVIYDLICRICSKRALAEGGRFIVSKHGVEVILLDEKRDGRVPSYVLDATKVLRAIYEECNGSMSAFTTVTHGIAEYYAHDMNEPIAYRLAKVCDRKNRRPRRNGIVSANVMMNNIGFAFDEAQPLKKG